MPLLDVKDLLMYYETDRGFVQAVDNISFTVDKKESLGLAGESGCGKTSAALAILKLLPSNARIRGGTINFQDKNILELSDSDFRKKIRWKKISMIFQGAMNALHPTYNIGHQISEALLLHENISKKEALERSAKLLELVGIESSKINRYPHELSGGMKQRTVAAMALACNPEMVIADEPTTALDVIVQAQVLKVMQELQRKLDLAWILISHDLSMIAETCTKVAIMYAGKIAEYGDVVSLYKEPLHPYTQALIAAFPSVMGKRTELASIPGFPPDLLVPPPGCRFHPRCPNAMDVCSKKDPVFAKARGKEHWVSCHLF